jgi:hypothetical protein
MKSFFLSRQLREKVLLAAFVLLVAAIWGSNLSQRAASEWRAFRQTSSDLRVQRMWLERQSEIEAAAAAAIAHLDSSRTYNEVRLSAELSAIANATGLGANASSEPGRTERTPQMAMHTLRFSLRRIDWPQFLRFYDELSKRAPYIHIQEFALNADRSGAQLNAALVVSSVEIAR